MGLGNTRKSENTENKDLIKKEINSIKSEITEIKKEIEIAKDSELYNIILFRKADDLFIRTRNKLSIWLAPWLILLTCLGTYYGINIYNIYDKMSEIKAYFGNDQRIKIIKMLVSDFYTVREIRMPIDLVLIDQTYDKNANEDVFLSASIENISGEFMADSSINNTISIKGSIDHSIIDRSKNKIIISLRNFYPFSQHYVENYEECNFFKIRIDITIAKNTDITHKKIRNLFNYTSGLMFSTINGIKIFQFKDVNDFKIDLNKIICSSVIKTNNSDKDYRTISCIEILNISELFKNLKENYEKSHLLYQQQ